MSLGAAMEQAAPGDLYWLHGGTYSGDWVFRRSGTGSAPIVWRAYTVNGDVERATIRGRIRTEGKWNWFWGLEITDPSESVRASAVEFFAEGSRVINCVVHEISNHGGIAAWNTGPGQVVYGTVIYRVGIPKGNGPPAPAHPIYTQNEFDTYGYKYFVQVMALDADVGVNSFNFHAYAINSSVSGIWVQDSFFDEGRFVIGHEKTVSHHNVVKSSYFHNMTTSPASISLGWKAPSQLEFSGNYIVGGTIVSLRHWGAGEDTFVQAKANKVTGNEIYRPLEGEHVRLSTAAYINGLKIGVPRIRNEDEWDDNVYGSVPFRGTLHAGDKQLEGLNLTQWRSFTRADRESNLKPFDAKSVTANEPATSKVVLLANEYERGRGNLAIYNWANEDSVPVDLSTVVRPGSTYKIRKARDFYGQVVASGVYGGGTVNVPKGSKFLSLFVVTSGRGPDFSAAGVVNAASYVPGVVPGSLATIFGEGLSEGIVGTAFPGGSHSFGGTTVRVGGKVAPLVAVTNSVNGEQISVQVPFDLTPAGHTEVEITKGGVSKVVGGVPVFREQPGIFEIFGSPGEPSFAAAIHLDGEIVEAGNPARRNEVISLFFTGGGQMQIDVQTGQAGPSPAPPLTQPVTVSLGGQAADVIFAGYAPGFLGLYQANVRTPANSPVGPHQPLTIQIAQRSSQTSTLAVQ